MKSKVILSLLLVVLLASCGTQKSGVSSTSSTSKARHSDPSIAFVQGVIDNEVEVQNIVGNASIKLSMGTENIKLSGALRMSRDKVVRLQLMLPLIGTEVGRLEFTPDYVLLLDKINKQYVKLNYNQLDFLQKNDISFYPIQALWWNELISPEDKRTLFDDAELYSANLDDNSTYVPITLQQGNVKYQWQANRSDNLITSAVVTYNSSSYGTSMLTWFYSNFTNVGNKKFPRTQEFSFTTNINGSSMKAEITIDMDEIKTSGDWETETDISAKYREVSIDYILSRLMSL